jgi:hypothetical protein
MATITANDLGSTLVDTLATVATAIRERATSLQEYGLTQAEVIALVNTIAAALDQLGFEIESILNAE